MKIKFQNVDHSKQGFELSEGFGEDRFDEFPVDDSYATHGNFQLVGNGKITNENCGKFKGLWGCLHVENHDIIAPDGLNYKGKIYVKKVRFTCHKPSCPVCYRYVGLFVKLRVLRLV